MHTPRLDRAGRLGLSGLQPLDMADYLELSALQVRFCIDESSAFPLKYAFGKVAVHDPQHEGGETDRGVQLIWQGYLPTSI